MNSQTSVSSDEALRLTPDEVSSRMPDERTLYELADLFRVFGDSTRIKILCALSVSDLCVADIASLLSMTQSAISHQLRVLKQVTCPRRQERTIVRVQP